MGTTPATPVPTQEAFDTEYYNLQPAPVKELMNMPYSGAKNQLAAKLATEGYVIDVTIMVWGWDAFLVTQQRIADGYTWVPSALMPPIQIAPGLKQGTTPPYDAAVMPVGAILVTWAISASMFPTPKA